MLPAPVPSAGEAAQDDARQLVEQRQLRPDILQVDDLGQTGQTLDRFRQLGLFDETP